MKKNVKISIIGSCVSRDAFEIPKGMKEYGKNEPTYEIERFVQSISPLSAVTPAIEPMIADALVEELQYSAASNFHKRCFTLDVRNSWEEYLGEVKSDWLVVDMSVARFSCRRIGRGYVSADDSLKLIFNGVAEEAMRKCPTVRRLTEGDLLRIDDLDEKKTEAIYREYFRRLSKLYPQKRIVVMEVRNVTTHVDCKHGTVAPSFELMNEKYRTENAIIDRAYAYAKTFLPNAHFIEALPTSFGDVYHKWGRHELHYADQVYLYYYRALEIITQKKTNGESEEAALRSLWESYTAKLFQQYTDLVANGFRSERSLLCVEDCARTGEFAVNGVKLTLREDFGFEAKGIASDETIFYLCQSDKNPLGGWKQLSMKLEPGKYLFTTRIKTEPNRAFVQLVLFAEGEEPRWISGNLSTEIELNHTYTHLLVRLVVRPGVAVEVAGRISLERLS